MAVSSHATGTVLLSSSRTQGILTGTANGARRVLAALRSGVRAIQTARMVSTLSNMSDQQLAELDISRSDIRRHADVLMARG